MKENTHFAVAEIRIELRGNPVHFPAMRVNGLKGQYEFPLESKSGRHVRRYVVTPGEREFPIEQARQEIEDLTNEADRPFGQYWFVLVTPAEQMAAEAEAKRLEEETLERERARGEEVAREEEIAKRSGARASALRNGEEHPVIAPKPETEKPKPEKPKPEKPKPEKPKPEKPKPEKPKPEKGAKPPAAPAGKKVVLDKLAAELGEGV